MSEDQKVEEKPLRNFLMRCHIEDLDGSRKNEIMDIIAAENRQDAEEYLVGWMAIRGFKVKKCDMVTDAEELRRTVTNITR
mgnify:CR=1 FL=1